MNHLQPQDSTEPRISVVVPVYNAMRYLPRTLPALRAAMDKHRAAELLYVDNGSDDGSAEWLQGKGARVLRSDATIAATRNLGARAARSPLLAFVDSDCEVSSEYLCRAEEEMMNPLISACGSRYLLPERPHWLERAWQGIHAEAERVRVVTSLPGSNFVVRRQAFEAVGGFREDLVTGEDSDLGLRLTEHGYVIRNTPSVWVRHLGNPRSLGEFFRQQRWHALGMFSTVRFSHIDRPVAMTFLHLFLLIATLAFLVRAPALGAVSLATIVWIVPASSLVYRWRRGGAVGRNVIPGLLLYQLYFLARIVALTRIVTRRQGEGS